MTTEEQHGAVSQKIGAQHNPKTIIAVAAFAAFLATFNETFLNVGFAPIMADLNVDVSTVQWLATAYMLGAAVMVPVSAFAYRSFPTRILFCATVALLVIGSVIGALAATFPVLLVGRVVQALGTGMLIPIGMNITLEVAPREKLGTYMGIMGAMTTLGPSSSVIFAGVILALANWHMLLVVFAVLSALCLLAGAVLLRDVAHLTHPHLDAASVALIGVALVGLLYGVSTVFSGNVGVACAAALVGVVFLALFVHRQGKLDEPLINLRPLTIAPFAVGTIINMVSLVTIFAMNIIVPTYMQTVLGTEPLVASLILFPAILCSCAVSPLAGRIYDKHGAGILLPAGFACIAIFSVATALLIATASPIVLALVYIPVICGSALIIGPVQSFALSKLAPELNPHGVTVMSTGFQIAGCIGSSLFTGVYAFVTANAIASGSESGLAATQGMIYAGVLVGAFAVVGFFLALWLRAHAGAQSQGYVAADAQSHGASAQTDTYAHRDSDLSADVLTYKEGAPSLLTCIMKTDVYTLSDTSTALDAMRLFSDKGISGAPVVDARARVIGFVSDGDVMRCLADQVPAFKSAWSFLVERGNDDFGAVVREAAGIPVMQIATRKVITAGLDADLGALAKLMAESHVKKVPIMDGGRMVGVINRSNITHYAIKSYLADMDGLQ